ncbi:non-reducing end beta-L-arabinofuranosidase [Abditibacteriota bacterium]|nr:non-reducing end beta-L-arabinofuranosidase [Abditibacteriota bacterium]
MKTHSLLAAFIAATSVGGCARADNPPTTLMPAEKASPALVNSVQSREEIASVVPQRATFFPLGDVQLLDSPFKAAQETDRKYLLSLDPDRLVAEMRRIAGLPTTAKQYGGWESGGSGIVGHYLSGLSYMVAATGDPQLKQKLDYTVAQIAEAQAKNGDGGLYSYDYDKNVWFAKLKQGTVVKQNVNAWYVMHKTLAGVRDAYLQAGNQQALDVLKKAGDWAVNVTAKLTDEQWQTMLDPEHGGPHEVFADLYAITGEKKYLDLAHHFNHEKVIVPLSKSDDSAVFGRHANSELAKFVGYERVYEMSGDKLDGDAARNFWNDVVERHTWANGGNGQWEHFFDPAQFPEKTLENCGPESCNTYNMLKLTGKLWSLTPDAKYMDYAEGALLNGILTTQLEGTEGEGAFVYYTSMRPNHYRIFSRPFDSFWCCVGTGMENHGKYGEMIYAHAPGKLWVNLFIPSKLTWREQGLTLTQTTKFPEEGRTVLTIGTAKPQQLALSIRVPHWVQGGAFKVSVNGAPQTVTGQPGGYATLTRTWSNGDKVEVAMPMAARVEGLPVGKGYGAVFYGPTLLVGQGDPKNLQHDDFFAGGQPQEVLQLARKQMPLDTTPTLVGTPQELAARLKPVAGQPLAFSLDAGQNQGAVRFAPFYRTFLERYTVYFPTATTQEFVAQKAERASLLARTLDTVQPGIVASETAHNFKSEKSATNNANWRDAGSGGFLSYDLKSDPNVPLDLVLSYWGDDDGRNFDVLVDGQVVGTEALHRESPGKAVNRTYQLPMDLTRGKTKLTLRLQPKDGSTAGGLFGVKLMKR